MKSEIAYFTVCNISYFPKAIVLAESLFKETGIKLQIYVADKKNELVPVLSFYEIKWVEDENIERVNHLTFMYDVTEFSTSIKPLLTLKLLKDFKKVIYLDPDICVYSHLNDLITLLDIYPILLTPHYITPINDIKENYDLGLMRFGSFNLGFYAVNDSNEGIEFLEWWSERCINLCFAESQFGLSVDQKWVSLAPCFFSGIKILFDKGYNMAFWNIHERTLTERGNKYFVNNISELKFFHFSSFDTKNPHIISKRPHKWNKDGRLDLTKICFNYAESLKRHDYNLSKIKYAYDYMSDGSYISPTLRRAYSAIYTELNTDHNPFNSDGILKTFVRQNFLLERNNIEYQTMGISNKDSFSFKFKLVNIVLRFILRVIGPNAFTNFSRLLVYLSSYRQNRSLWKF
jgi:hypothetical protein